MNIESLSLSAKTGIIVFTLCVLPLIAYTLYTYHYTLPVIPRGKKILLNALRVLALLLLVFILIEPVLLLVQKETEEPIHLLYIDNSRSMKQVTGGFDKAAIARGFASAFAAQGIPGKVKIFTFGSKLSPVATDSLQALGLDEPSTAFYPPFAEMKKSESNIRSVTIVSDGILTDGADPSPLAEDAGIPVFTVAVGDTTVQTDLAAADILTNEVMYAGTSTPVRVNVLSRRIAGAQAAVTLFEEDTQIGQTSIDVREGINTALFSYLPRSSGEKKLRATVSPYAQEKNTANNKAVKYVNVRGSKMKVALIAGMPSADVTFIKQALESDTNITCRTIIEIGPNKFLTPYNERMLDSAEAFFFVHFPLPGTSPQLFSQVVSRLQNNYKPFFIVLGDAYSAPMLQQIDNLLPVSLKRNNGGSITAQPRLSEVQAKHPLLREDDPSVSMIWNNLAPVQRPNIEAPAKPEAEVLLTLKTATADFDLPLFAVRNLGAQRSAVLLASGVWRWRLLNNAQTDIFTRFMLASFKWLHSGGDRERLRIRTNKKNYAAGETVEYFAELYDESYNPVNEAVITVETRTKSDKRTFAMNPLGNGLYEYAGAVTEQGDHLFTASVADRNQKQIQSSGRFSVGDIDQEMVNTVTDAGFLRYLSTVSGGAFFLNDNYQPLFEKLKSLAARSSRVKIRSSEIDLWSNTWLLSLVILLLAAEWFIRKREGML